MIRHRALIAAGTALSWLAIPAFAFRQTSPIGHALMAAAVPMLDRTYEPDFHN